MCVCVRACVCVLVMAVLVETTAAQQVPTSVTAFQGQQVMFNCSGTTLTWIYDSRKLFESPDTLHSTDRNKYDVVGTYDLVINNVQESDAGTYQCDIASRPDLLMAALVVIGNMYVKFLCTSQFKLNVE